MSLAKAERATLLPDGLSCRRPTVADAARILPLVAACDLRVLGESDMTLTEVEGFLGAAGVDNERGGQLVLGTSGDVVGWLLTEVFDSGDEVWVDLYALEEVLLHWLMWRAFEYVESLVAERGRPLRMKVGCYQQDTMYGGILAAYGFEVVRLFWQMKRSLDGLPPEQPPRDDLVIRLADAGAEDDLRLLHRLLMEAFADHWDHTFMPFDEWYPILDSSPGKDPSQWWVAEVDGAPAGLLLGDNTRAENLEGYVDTLGVLREFRGRGVAKALLAHAFSDFVRRGFATAALGVDSQSPTGATRLYKSMGMSVDKVIVARQQTVNP